MSTMPPATVNQMPLATAPGGMPGQGQSMALQSIGSTAIKSRIAAIQGAMRDVMQEGTHFGVVPGTEKPSLWKPGAEIIASMFQLAPILETTATADFPEHVTAWKARRKIWFDGPAGRDFKWETEEGETTGYYEVTAFCALVAQDGRTLARVSGSANNLEAKYRTQSVWDTRNTIRKMAEKRAFVAAVLLATGASDAFTQDVEDQDEDFVRSTRASGAPQPRGNNQSSTGRNGSGNGLNEKQMGLVAVKARDVLGLKDADHEAFIAWFRGLPASGAHSAKSALDALCKGGENAENVRGAWKKATAAAAPSEPAAQAPAAEGGQQ